VSNVDSFIEEVTEEVRRDRLFRLFRRYGWIALVLVLALVGGAAWIEYRRASERAAAEALGDGVIAAMSAPDAAGRAAAMAALDPKGAEAAAMVAQLEVAQRIVAEDRAAALQVLERVAADAATPGIWRELAQLKAVMLRGSDMAVADRLAALEPLSQPGRPFRVLALEQTALAQVDGGDPAAAIAILRGLMQDTETTPALRQRAQQLMVALGAGPDAA
jgi:hypothetical protein